MFLKPGFVDNVQTLIFDTCDNVVYTLKSMEDKFLDRSSFMDAN